MQTVVIAGEIRSGEFGDAEIVQGYRFERLGEVLVERVIWGVLAAPRRYGDVVVAGPGYVWFRFWALSHNQVLERYYGEQGQLIGTQIDVCMPPICDERGWRAKDLHLDIWMSPDGRVTLYGETSFGEAAQQGQLSPQEVEYAEEHVRRLTAGIAQGRFPPPIVRRWQVDPSRIHSIVAERIRGV
jgi:predicted RNA-binding protein associated with RNAse of E/G family